MMQKPSSPNTLAGLGAPSSSAPPASPSSAAVVAAVTSSMTSSLAPTSSSMLTDPNANDNNDANTNDVDMDATTDNVNANGSTANDTSNANANGTGSRNKVIGRKRRGEGGGNLTVEQKRRICEKHRSTPKITQKDLCRWAKLEFNLLKAPTQPTMSNILKNEHLFKDAIGGVLGAERKTIRPTKHAHFDQVLANWVMERQNKGTITGDMIKQKGRELAKQMGLEGKLGFSNGWLASFKARHGLVKRASANSAHAMQVAQQQQQHHHQQLALQQQQQAQQQAQHQQHQQQHGGNQHFAVTGAPDSAAALSAPPMGSATLMDTLPPHALDPGYMLPPVSMDLTLDQIQEVLRDYAPSDIFTVDETGLFFRASPSKLVQGDDAQVLLADEAKLSVLLATNADASELLEPYIIGSLVAPKHIKNASISQLGYHYVCSSRARMTVFIFQQWLRDFNARMASAHRHVVLLMDNAPSHVLGCVNLSNVRVIMFAPHLGMKVQPMRGGILQAFKGKYRLKHLTLAIDHLEDGLSEVYHITQLQAMKWITEAWQQTARDVIVGAWKPLGVQAPFVFDEATGGNATASGGASGSSGGRGGGGANSSNIDDKNVEEELWGLLYCLQLSGIVNTKVLVNNRWENDIHKRLNEDMIEDPKENDAEFHIPDPSTLIAAAGPRSANAHYQAHGMPQGHHLMTGGNEGVDGANAMGPHVLTAKEQLKAFRDVIRYLERTGTADARDPQLLNVIEVLKKKQLSLRFDNASSTTLTI